MKEEIKIGSIRMMDKELKDKLKDQLKKNPLICQECLDDDRIAATRDIDGICAHCGKGFCGRHLVLHLKNVHCVGMEHLYFDLEKG